MTTTTYAHETTAGCASCVIELALNDFHRRANVSVVWVSGDHTPLGSINRVYVGGKPTVGPARAGDAYDLDWSDAGMTWDEVLADPIEVLRRCTAQRYGWREVTAETPVWDGQQMIAPVTGLAE